MNGPHWHVLGAGAMGCLFASALHRGGTATTLLLREHTGNSTAPVIVRDDNGSCEFDLPVATAADCGMISHLLVTTKAQDVRGAVAGVAHCLNSDSQLLLMVNGMGLAEELQADYPDLDIYCGTTTEGAYCTAPRCIQHAGRGQTRIGRQGQQQPARWINQWSRAITSCTWDAHIDRSLWLKLAINCAINPLTALHDCCNGELARRPELAAEVSRLCSEIAQVCSAAGYPRIAATLQQSVGGVIAGTADNRSSMLQDTRLGRRTEIDYITGYLLKVAGHYGVETPRNRALFESIRNMAH